MPLADRALIVGINRYPGIENLQGPENDANDFYDWVTSAAGGGVDPANAKRLRSSDFPPVAPRDERPAQEQVNDFFTDIDEAADRNNNEGLGSGLRAGRRLWMFFSGHGFAPSLETSGVLMANATLKRIFNIAAARWADQIFQGGWFDEVVLFQDACRSRIAAANLTEPFFRPRNATRPDSKRFYAFSSRDQKLSKELPCPDGKVRGVFAATLLDGLRGAAREPVTKAITARSLRTYLQDNMKNRLSDADRANPDIAQDPDFRDPHAFDIVPATAAAVERYRVAIQLPAANLNVALQDGGFQPIPTVDPVPQLLSVDLPRGLYRIVVQGGAERLFQVTGPGTGAGGAIDVRV